MVRPLMAGIVQSRWLGVVSYVCIFAAWEAASDFGWVNRVLLPPPSGILPVLRDILASGAFIVPLGQTLLLLFAGYAVACILGIGFGLAMGTSQRIENLFE